MWFFDHLPGPSYTISYRFIYIHLANKCWNVSAQGPLFFSVWSLFLGGLIHICSFNYHLFGKDSDAGMDWGQEEKGMTEDEMAELHHWIDGREFEWTPGIGDGQGGLACCNSWGRRESDTTERVNWTEVNWYNLTLWDLIQLFPLYPFCHNLSSIGHHLCFLRESQQLSSYLLGLLYIYSFSKKKHKIILLNKN